MIRVRDLTLGYDRPLMEHVDFDVDAGEVFLILGGSGCGKSTLLRAMIGLLVPMAGTIEVAGEAVALNEDERPGFGVLFQSGALFGSMTLAENVSLPLKQWTELPQAEIDCIVSRKLALVGLDGFENHLPAEISGGMKKRAGIARAMALDPPLLFLDEPSAGLDPITSAELDELIRSLSEGLGTTMVIVTHELESIYAIGQNCIMLDRDARGVIAQGPPRVLRDESDHPTVRRFFHRTTEHANSADQETGR